MGLLQRCVVRYTPVMVPAEINPMSVNVWVNGYAFILSLLAPLWTICKSFTPFFALSLILPPEHP